MLVANSTAVTESELPPCCIRVKPDDSSLVFLGTYKLDKETGQRSGSIEVLKIEGGGFEPYKKVPTSSAILDLKFNPFDSSLIASAHSSGEIRIWRYGSELTCSKSIQVTDQSTLVTSLFFSPTNPTLVLVSLTSGHAMTVDIENGNVSTFIAKHSLECWTGAFGELGASENVIFTGGDDAQLIAHDLRTMQKIWSTNYRHHDAGVVSILSPGKSWLTNRNNELWTGSYDDNLRIFDLRTLDGGQGPILVSSLLPTVKCKENLNGGVWRLIPAPDCDDVLACCMYDGARIIRPRESGFEVTTYFKGKHESMCYGGDWRDPASVVTCSFYDNIVHLWEPPMQ